MDPSPPRDLAAMLSSNSTCIAERWQQALARTGFVAASVPEVQAQLAALFGRVVQAVLADPVDRHEGRAVGAAVARLRYLHPDALERTHDLLSQAFIEDLSAAEQLLVQPRLALILASLSAGFFAEARTIILIEQEALRNAVLTELDRANHELRAVLDAAVDAMVLISPERYALMINRRFSEVFGIPPEIIVGKRFDELRSIIEPIYANPEVMVRLITRVASSAVEAADDLIQVRPRARVLQLRSVPVQRADGVLLGRLHIFRDVTREREVDRREREFLAGVSHELRTPLTSIKGYVDLLLTERLGAAEHQEFLEIIQHNAERMGTLVNDLIDLSRLELGQLALSLQRVDLPVLLDQVVSALRRQIRAKGQELIMDIPLSLPPLLADGDRLSQVFTNLVVNAHHYTSEGGRITVQARANNGSVNIAVSDTGVGMSAEEQTHLFTKFYRVRNSRTQGVRGTGLGLAITRSLVELHQGTISVESAPGVGSVFRVALPLQPDDG